MSQAISMSTPIYPVKVEHQTNERRVLAWRIALIAPLLICLMMCVLMSPGHETWRTASGILLLTLVITVSVTDVLWHRIPNWATYSAAAWAVLINAYASTLGTPRINQILGAVGIGDCLLGAAVPFFFMLVIFSLTGGGAGDVKLTAAIGAFLGLAPAIDAILFSLIIAGGFAIFRAIWTMGLPTIVVAIWRSVGSFFFPIWILPPSEEHRAFFKERMPLGPSFALGTALVLFEVDVAGIVNTFTGRFGVQL